MKKTLLVGDLHLKAAIILPMVEQAAKVLNVEQVILMGDYVDAFGQSTNTQLYLNELDYLLLWKSKMQTKGLKIITLMGNHDAPYLINSPKIYSLVNNKGFRQVGKRLIELNLQVALKLGKFLVSHAGYTRNFSPESWQLIPFPNSSYLLDEETTTRIEMLAEQVGFSRGGATNQLGSPIWADFQHELLPFFNESYPDQIVSHTPQSQIKVSPLTGIDTFTVKPQLTAPYAHLLGSGEILLFENNHLTPIPLNWNQSTTSQQIVAYFQQTQLIKTFKDITINYDEWSLTVDQQKHFLTNLQFDVFIYFYERAGKVITPAELRTKVFANYDQSRSSFESTMQVLTDEIGCLNHDGSGYWLS